VLKALLLSASKSGNWTCRGFQEVFMGRASTLVGLSSARALELNGRFCTSSKILHFFSKRAKQKRERNRSVENNEWTIQKNCRSLSLEV
jgi:hypothetical protein